MNSKNSFLLLVLVGTVILATHTNICLGMSSGSETDSESVSSSDEEISENKIAIKIITLPDEKTVLIDASNTDITDEQLTHICAKYPNIAVLILHGCKNLRLFAIQLQQLIGIDIGDTEITCKQRKALWKNNPKLNQIRT
jgi:hypothetical protein